MKIFIGFIFLLSSLYAVELIHISNSTDANELKVLYAKYKKEIVIYENRSYIVPSQCLLERGYGGLSNNKSLNLPSDGLLSGNIVINEKIFKATDTKDIKESIAKQKISDEVEGKVAKAFLDDNSGHLFGGISQGKVNLDEQKIVVKSIKNDFQHPECKLLKNGLGYSINIDGAKIYKDSKLSDIKERTLFFEK